MSKTKMRCTTCGKWFQSANAKEVTCPDCTQKARKEKLAAKNAPPPAIRAAGPGGQTQASPSRSAPPKPKAAQSGTNQWLDKLNDVKIGEPDQAPVKPKIPTAPAQRDAFAEPGIGRGSAPGRPGSYRDERGVSARAPVPYHVSGSVGATPSIGQRPAYPRPPAEGGPGRGPGGYKPGGPRPATLHPKPKGKAAKPAAPPKPKREKIPPPPPFVPTPEQVTQVEERYTELAQPAEFDGIRTQIAHELNIPKAAVKKIIKDLRSRQHIPSWWELQTYKGSSEELEKIKAIYEPYLPVPPVGVHKTIADELTLKPGIVYQAIKSIRQELSLPQYNDPSYHEIELARLAGKRQKPTTSEQVATEQADRPEATPETFTEQSVNHEQSADRSTVSNA